MTLQVLQSSLTSLLPLLDGALGERDVLLFSAERAGETGNCVAIDVTVAVDGAQSRCLRVDLMRNRAGFCACAEGRQTVCDDALDAVADVIARTAKAW
mgnify:FL=1